MACPVPCDFTTDRTCFEEADAVVYHIPSFRRPVAIPRRAGQKAVAWSMESEINYPLLADRAFMGQFDITMTYRQDSRIWCAYFEPWRTAEALRSRPEAKAAVAPVVCFVSNTGRTSYNRDGYLGELMRHIAVDSYGRACRNRTLKQDRGRETKLAVIARYRFTLALENSICPDYVTEKFFDPLIAGSVPVYLGAPNIEEFAPADRCYIDATGFAGPGELAQYLNKLSADQDAYNEYLLWKTRTFRPSFLAKVEQQRLDPFCRLCLHLHKDRVMAGTRGGDRHPSAGQ